MQVKGFSWVGIRTNKFNETVSFYKDILKIPSVIEKAGFAAFDLPNGDTIEIFSDSYPTHKHFTTGPVVGFDVDDIYKARLFLEKKGIEFIGAIEGDPKKSRWAHFKGPDGKIYELKQRAK